MTSNCSKPEFTPLSELRNDSAPLRACPPKLQPSIVIDAATLQHLIESEIPKHVPTGKGRRLDVEA